MGNLTSTPGLPPASLPDLPIQWSFVNEHDVWPIVHFLVPFSIYVYFRSFWFTIFLFYLSESGEALFSAIWPDASALNEIRQDSLVSDPLMAFLAIACAELFLQVIEWNHCLFFWSSLSTSDKYHSLSFIRQRRRMYFNWTLFFKYAFQLILFNAVHVGSLFYFGDPALFSLGLLIATIWTPFWIWVASIWNKNDPLVIPVDDATDVFLHKEIPLKVIEQQKCSKTTSFYLWFAVLYALFCAINIYEWTSYFLMSVGTALVFLTMLLLLRTYQRLSRAYEKGRL